MLQYSKDNFDHLRPTLEFVETRQKEISKFTNQQSSGNSSANEIFQNNVLFNKFIIEKREEIYERSLFYNKATWTEDEWTLCQYHLDSIIQNRIQIHELITIEELFRLTNRAFIKNRVSDKETSSLLDIVRQYNSFLRDMNWHLTAPQKKIFDNQKVGILGRDKVGRPLVYICLTDVNKDNAEDYSECISKVIALVKTKMLIPGVIEQFNLCIDHESKRPPFNQTHIMEVMKKTQLFCNNVYLAYNLRISYKFLFTQGLNFFAKFGLLKPGDREKVVAVTSSELKNLHKDISPDQLPKFLGGTQENQIWPPNIKENDQQLITKADLRRLELNEFQWPCDLTQEDLIRLQDTKKCCKKTHFENVGGGRLYDQQKHDIINKFQK